MEITHLGHACLLVAAGGRRVLVDPGTFSDLEGVHDLDAVVITHQHPDHCDPARVPDLLGANPRAQVLVEPQTAEVLARAGLGSRTESMTAGGVVDLGGLTLTPVGDLHAVIHPYVARVGNLGVVLRAEDEPSLFHPGDALDGDPGEVDLLGVAVNAPWAKVVETIEFVRRVGPRRGVVPIHDGLLSEAGRGLYVSHIGDHGAEGGVEVLDLRGAGTTTV
ncbi:MBL fold metallo-hydrolase [Ornithinimicrobium flavum]|uniref:MBL fold metallo-hydrolase n=1 Tax=Ornithinimicrobium flavum TaxID=1288636 RepID=UPI00106F5707|nr:MBL fold metallo-hydrolase [Ornithinimicrobium flavum]